MNRAEKFIHDYTRNCSNVVAYSGMAEGSELRYHEWLTPDQAKKAVEIAREEMIEKVCKYLEPKIWTMNMGDQKDTDECIKDFKQAMKDE